MTALGNIREAQEKIAEQCELVGDPAWTQLRKQWLKLQREALAILRGERCEEHAFEDCRICKPGFIPRPDHPFTGETMAVIVDADPGDENDHVPKPPEDGSHEQKLQQHLFSERTQ